MAEQDDNTREVESAASEATESVAEAASDAADAVRDAPEEEPQPIHPHPAYEDYEAPDSNIMPKVIAAILGGLVVGWLILRRRGRD
ncbi:hypothetical protein G4X40_10410 [Rhodococcus sp. D2-41]|uniref:Uncharacterized protein n=1 Tax=Speluncibacter jeojiensis TaxID=2710754 RepID=A0A9X4LXQ5_9ACTN|nr:hypothetical protein [Rhodococcus sp. D2-41]MDG3010560.1 hypothetical protein [Rhodococcus sp. D2-41]MDG3014308.1 hypothetical protein [Corynebacteriales bacterium D3-21]